MSERTEQLIQAARTLSRDERRELVERLVEILADDLDPDLEALWTAEARRRLDAYRAGEVAAVDAYAFLDGLRRP